MVHYYDTGMVFFVQTDKQRFKGIKRLDTDRAELISVTEQYSE